MIVALCDCTGSEKARSGIEERRVARYMGFWTRCVQKKNDIREPVRRRCRFNQFIPTSTRRALSYSRSSATLFWFFILRFPLCRSAIIGHMSSVRMDTAALPPATWLAGFFFVFEICSLRWTWALGYGFAYVHLWHDHVLHSGRWCIGLIWDIRLR